MNKYNLPTDFLNLISEHSPDMLWAKDIEGKYLFANKKICEKLLMVESSQEVIGKTDIHFALKERAKYPENPEWHTFGELCFDSDEQVLQKLQEMRFEEYGNIEGKLVYFDVHKAPFYNEDGNLIGVIGSARDITKNKEHELALEDSKTKLRTMYEANPNSVIIFDKENFLECNQSTLDMFGIDCKEEFYKNTPRSLSPIQQMCGRHSHVLAQEYIDQAMLTGSVYFEWVFENKITKKLFYTDILLTAMELNGVEVLQAVICDISEKKNVESELQNTNYLMHSGPVVVFEWSPEEGWPIQFVSSNVEKILGIDYEKLMKGINDFSDYIHPDDLLNVVKEVEAYLKEKKKTFLQEYRLVREDGSLIWIQDFTTIDYDHENMPRTIKGYIFDDTAKKLSDERIEYLNAYDKLTDLPNRYKLQRDMNEKSPFACAIFNISSFREINDFFGVNIGDSILKQLSKEIKEMHSYCYRIGGDEFVLLFHEVMHQSELEEIIKNQIAHLHKIALVIADETIKINFNVGIAIHTDDNISSSDKLLTNADIALHQAKEKKISYSIYEKDEKIEETYKKNIAMTTTVHKALTDDRIVCHYQPIVSLDTNTISKYESLVRMLDDSGEIILPMEFLSVCKKTKLYSRITKKVVNNACNYFMNKEIEFSINLSIDDINDPVIVQEIIKTIVDTNTAQRIVFEILETEGIENYSSVIRFIKQVKELGAKIAIDDFGSGYSNFEHILQLNVDYIKIDGSLIQGIASNKKHRIVVETIVEFAKKMGAKTIAEYVCDEDVYNVVKSLGIDFSQGYYTGKPESLN